MSRFIGMLRIKNEATWIREVIQSMLPLCERIYILDDHSTDDTPHIVSEFSEVVLFRSNFEGVDESRDKNWLLKAIIGDAEYRGDFKKPSDTWVILIDGDEVLMPGAQEAIQKAAASGLACAYGFRILYLWDKPAWVRTDGVYGRFYRPSMFKLISPDLRFQTTKNGGNFHCSSIPAQLFDKCRELPEVRIKHYGYMSRQRRLAKYRWYNEIDPHNAFEDYYRHMVQGDVPEVPANIQLRHAGPLRIEELS